jgi:hypothetical protein
VPSGFASAAEGSSSTAHAQKTAKKQDVFPFVFITPFSLLLPVKNTPCGRNPQPNWTVTS